MSYPFKIGTKVFQSDDFYGRNYLWNYPELLKEFEANGTATPATRLQHNKMYVPSYGNIELPLETDLKLVPGNILQLTNPSGEYFCVFVDDVDPVTYKVTGQVVYTTVKCKPGSVWLVTQAPVQEYADYDWFRGRLEARDEGFMWLDTIAPAARGLYDTNACLGTVDGFSTNTFASEGFWSEYFLADMMAPEPLSSPCANSINSRDINYAFSLYLTGDSQGSPKIAISVAWLGDEITITSGDLTLSVDEHGDAHAAGYWLGTVHTPGDVVTFIINHAPSTTHTELYINYNYVADAYTLYADPTGDIEISGNCKVLAYSLRSV